MIPRLAVLAMAAVVAAAAAPAAGVPGQASAAPAAGPGAAPRPARPGVVWHAAAAARPLLARVLSASGVERRPEPPDASYLRDLAASVFAAVARLIDRVGSRLALPLWLLQGFVAALALAAAGLLARTAWVRRRRAAGGGPAAMATGAGETGAGEAAGAEASDLWGAAAWKLELERQLVQGRVHEALRATWWWLARSLAGAQAEPTWTGRELLRRCRREDLGALMRQLDGMTYGPRQPATEEVRGLAVRLEAALA